MDVAALQRWLAEPRTTLVEAVADGVSAHVADLRSRGADFYGYALLPGEYYDLGGLVAATHREADITVPADDPMHRYYRYSVDEWATYEPERFAAADALIGESYATFATLHTKADPDDLALDEFQIAHADALLAAIVDGLDLAKTRGVFGEPSPYLIVWFSDSGLAIMNESARRLNPPEVAAEYLAEFGND